MTGYGELGDEPLGHVKGCKFVDHLSDSQLLKKHSPPWS
jgi:hypothetical protein